MFLNGFSIPDLWWFGESKSCDVIVLLQTIIILDIWTFLISTVADHGLLVEFQFLYFENLLAQIGNIHKSSKYFQAVSNLSKRRAQLFIMFILVLIHIHVHYCSQQLSSKQHDFINTQHSQDCKRTIATHVFS